MTRQKFLVTFIFLFIGFLGYADNPTGSVEQNKPIIIKKASKHPRTPDYGSDIMAYYQDGVVYLQFGFDMGEVEISVINESTGEVWQQTEDTAFGSASITTSTAAGDYFITIVTDDASCYSGSFSL